MTTLTEFRCPLCNVKIPVEYMSKKTKFIDYPKHPNLLCCIGCAEEYEELVRITMEKRVAEGYAEKSGIKPETILAIRKEQEQVREEDEKLVDEEVDVMDGEKGRKVFRKKGDRHEQSKPPLQVIREQFAKGLQKSRQKRILLPSIASLKGGQLHGRS